MSVQVYKNGIVSAGGSGVGENLLQTQIDSSGWGLWASNIGTREKVIINNKTWAHVIQNESANYGGFNCGPDHNKIIIDPTKRYTWSCVAKGGDLENSVIILWCYWRSTEGGANIYQNSKKFTITKEPMRVIWNLPQRTHSTYTINRINLMMGSSGTANNEIYFTDIKFEEGLYSTPWTPASSDYGIGSEHGFIETDGSIAKFYGDFAEANEFIEY